MSFTHFLESKYTLLSPRYNTLARVKKRLHTMVRSKEAPQNLLEKLIPTNSLSMKHAVDRMNRPLGEMIEKMYNLVKGNRVPLSSFIQLSIKLNPQKVLTSEIRTIIQKTVPETRLYRGESLDLMLERWAKLERDLKDKKSESFDVSKIPDVYDMIKYDLQHNSTLGVTVMNDLFVKAKLLADIVIPQEYGITKDEKLNIAHGYCVPLLSKIRTDLQEQVYFKNGFYFVYVTLHFFYFLLEKSFISEF